MSSVLLSSSDLVHLVANHCSNSAAPPNCDGVEEEEEVGEDSAETERAVFEGTDGGTCRPEMGDDFRGGAELKDRANATVFLLVVVVVVLQENIRKRPTMLTVTRLLHAPLSMDA